MLGLGLRGLSLGQRGGGVSGPTITTAPVISGDPSVEANTLTLTTAPVWDGAVSSSYVWQLNNGGWADIALSTDSTTVTVQAGEHIYDYRVVATATNADGTSTTISNVLEGLDAPVLSNFVDNLDQDPPNALFDSTEAGTLTWDFDASATPPSKGAGSIGTGTDSVTSGANNINIDLSAYPDETGYLHLRVTNDAGDSNVLTSQEITTPGYTNILLSPDTFANAAWFMTSADRLQLAADVETPPSGGSTEILEIGSSPDAAYRGYYQNFSSTATLHRLDVVMKDAGGGTGWAAFCTYDATSGLRFSYFNVGGGATGSAGTGHTISITALGSGWYRCRLEFTYLSTSTQRVYIGLAEGNGDTNITTYTQGDDWLKFDTANLYNLG